MRTETKTINIFKFNELSEEAKANARMRLGDINLDHVWWEFVYSDAKDVGVEIVEFDLGRGNSCKLRIANPDETIDAILKNHGESCGTYKVAVEYRNTLTDEEGYWIDEAVNDFTKDLATEYLSMLNREHEYLTSEAAILETIEANDYEFTEDGNLY